MVEIATESVKVEKEGEARKPIKLPSFLEEKKEEKKEAQKIDSSPQAFFQQAQQAQQAQAQQTPQAQPAQEIPTSFGGFEGGEAFEGFGTAEKKAHLQINLAERCPTGVPGFDEVIEGGFERPSINLVGGGAGTGKSIFCTQFIINGIEQYNEPGIYISFEENKGKFFKHMKRFGWNLDKHEKEGKFVYVEYTPAQVKQLLQEGGGLIENLIMQTKAKRIIIDSLTAFSLLYPNELTRRQATIDLFSLFNKWAITVLMTMETESDPEKHKSSTLEFVVDSVILIYNVRKGDIRERSLEVRKMRGTKHAAKIFPITIADKGMVVFPEETIF